MRVSIPEGRVADKTSGGAAALEEVAHGGLGKRCRTAVDAATGQFRAAV